MAKDVKVLCPKCGYRYDVQDSFIGKFLVCPNCKHQYYARPVESITGPHLQEPNLKKIIQEEKKVRTGRIQKQKSENLRQKRAVRIFLSILSILSAFFILLCVFAVLNSQCYKWLRYKPDPDSAYRTAVDYMKKSGKLLYPEDTKFDEAYVFEEIEQEKGIYRIKSKLETKVLFTKTPKVYHYEVDMKYLGNGNWEYIDSRYNK